MTNFAGRLKKVEDSLRDLVPNEEDIPRFFIRIGDLDTPREDQLQFESENPDFKGKIYIVLIGERFS
jgi:hypothetical protein